MASLPSAKQISKGLATPSPAHYREILVLDPQSSPDLGAYESGFKFKKYTKMMIKSPQKRQRHNLQKSLKSRDMVYYNFQ